MSRRGQANKDVAFQTRRGKTQRSHSLSHQQSSNAIKGSAGSAGVHGSFDNFEKVFSGRTDGCVCVCNCMLALSLATMLSSRSLHQMRGGFGRTQSQQWRAHSTTWPASQVITVLLRPLGFHNLFLGSPSPQSCSSEKKLYLVHCGKCRGFFANFLRPFSLEVEGPKSAKKIAQNFAAFFAGLLQKKTQELRSGGLRAQF